MSSSTLGGIILMVGFAVRPGPCSGRRPAAADRSEPVDVPIAAHPALPGAPVLLAALCCICCENTPCLWAHGLLTIKFLGTGVSR